MGSALAAFRTPALAISIGCLAFAAANAAEPRGIALTQHTPSEFELPEDLQGRSQSDEDWRAYVGAYRTQGDETRIGIILPAPSTAAWDLRVPEGAELRYAQTLLRLDAQGDPVAHWLDVEVEAHDGEIARFTAELLSEGFEERAIDLSRWSGEQVRLRLQTRSERRSPRSLPFVAHPFIATPRTDTRRVVLIFVDTLRSDHVGAYGYERDTTPRIDALAKSSVVFETARSVSPWTLPSARSALTGHLPDRYDTVEPLPERLRRRGWATAMFAANIYLDSRFRMQRGWEQLRSVIEENAQRQTDLALAWLRAQRGRDSLLLVHYMDPHLPYAEPSPFRELFASGPPPPPLATNFALRGDIQSLAKPVPETVRSYLIGRYDNNIRYADHEIGRLLDALDEDDLVVLFSDHGEEFFEHGGFEHGHTLYDELLRVVLLLRAPSLAPARISQPVSLIDLAPTVLDLLGLPHDDMYGRSLIDLAKGSAAAQKEVDARSLGFGWPLYGSEAWGFLKDGEKWTTTAGRVAHYELDRDAGEQHDLAARSRSPATLIQPLRVALARELPSVLRLHVSRAPQRPTQDLVVTLHVPGGIEKSWLGDDPLAHSKVGVVIDGETLRATWRARARGGREVFILPKTGVAAALGRLRGSVRLGQGAETPLARLSPALNGPGRAAGMRTGDRRSVELGLAVAPDPQRGDVPLVGDHPELREQLRALGYEAGPDAEPDHGQPRP